MGLIAWAAALMGLIRLLSTLIVTAGRICRPTLPVPVQPAASLLEDTSDPDFPNDEEPEPP
jgi:hypothetical protein